MALEISYTGRCGVTHPNAYIKIKWIRTRKEIDGTFIAHFRAGIYSDITTKDLDSVGIIEGETAIDVTLNEYSQIYTHIKTINDERGNFINAIDVI